MRKSGGRSVEARFVKWIEQYDRPDIVQRAVELPLRRDMVTLLQYLRDNKVVGTQSTGNLPRKVVRAVAQQFVNPPELDYRIGDEVYSFRSETEVWPVFFLHLLAWAGSMVVKAPGQRWVVTPYGENFLGMHPLIQVCLMLTIWWFQVNWRVAYPGEGIEESLPKRFQQTVLARLRGLPVGERIKFEEFADSIIEETGLTWNGEAHFAQSLLRYSIERMVIRIMADFGVLEPEYQKVSLDFGTTTELAAFAVTSFGTALLEAVLLIARL